MSQTIDAVFDGSVLRPDKPLKLKANTRVRVTVEAIEKPVKAHRSFLRTAESLKLEGPPDWASNLDHYLYGEAQPQDG